MSEKAKEKRILGQLFPFVILAYAGVIYYGTLVRLYLMKDSRLNSPSAVVRHHNSGRFPLTPCVCHLVLLLGYVRRPWQTSKFLGRQNLKQGFYLENPDERRRKYCLICHTFKPERCHHCSTCGKCVLNMDHHCPWLSNCVGFFNRKYFFQLICYTWVTLLLALVVTTIPLIRMIVMLSGSGLQPPYNMADFVFCCISFVFICVLFITLTNFIAFHWDLVERNSTTLENLEEKRSGQSVGNMYDQGSEFNWAQVMGKNKALWLIPYIGKAGNPNGDGVVFPSKGSERDSSIMDYERNRDNYSKLV